MCEISHFRKKIQACVARGGFPDPDCPNDQESVRYRVFVGMEETENWQQAAEVSTRTNLDPESAQRVMAVTDPVLNTIRAPDPMGLVREQLDALQAASSAAPQQSAASQPTARAGGGRA
jgi:hypothetical protein